jgi:cell division protein FtsB
MSVMARGNKTSSIPRSTAKKSRKRRRIASAVSDRTRPTPRSERLLPRFIGRALMAIGAIVVVISFGNSFLVLPATSWLGQREEIDARTDELETMKRATDELQTEVDRLKTPAGVEDAAREEIGYVMAGERRQLIVGDSEAPVELPTGWPYDLVTQIIAVRVNEAAAKAAAENPDPSGDGVTVVTEPLP